MTRQEHIELVARAMLRKKTGDLASGFPFEALSEGAKKMWIGMATAAITALERAGAYVGEK